MEAVLQQQLVYVSTEQEFKNHINSFDKKICQIRGFSELPQRDQCILMRMHIKQLNIDPRYPRNKEEFDIVCQTYGHNPALIGDPIPVAMRPDFKLKVSTYVVPLRGERKVRTKTLSTETTQWLIDNGYCLGPRAMNFDNILCLMRRESCGANTELKIFVHAATIMGFSWALLFIAIRSFQNLRIITNQGTRTWMPHRPQLDQPLM